MEPQRFIYGCACGLLGHYELYAGSDLKHLDVVCNGAMLSRTGLPGVSWHNVLDVGESDGTMC